MPGLEKLAAESPESGARCTQDKSEPVLFAAAQERGASMRFNTALISFQQDAQKINAVIRDRETGKEELIQADYLIAADGANSRIREELKAATTGKGALADLLNIYFEADLADFVRGREFSLCIIDRPDIAGLFTSINNSDRWVFHLRYDGAAGEKPDDFTAERLVNMLKKVIGLPDINIRIISVLPWQPTVKVVDEMQHGRIFLAGDAAHVMTPYGGKGAASGIQDVHNLAWKLAAVIHGKAHPRLLKTYSAERQPIGLLNATSSGKMADEKGMPKMKGRMKMFGIIAILNRLGFRKQIGKLMAHKMKGMLGIPEFTYRSAAVIEPSAPDKGKKEMLLRAKPGTRFPHVRVLFQQQEISTLDLLRRSFVLFTGMGNNQWIAAAADTGGQLKIPIPVYSLGNAGNLIYTERSISDILEINNSGAVLVRPDGFVAWKTTSQPGNTAATLLFVLKKILVIE
jgi:2-polyprenyl-6-methoxyphenol hydroxylase-like FAD-dependent oxidoreductase